MVLTALGAGSPSPFACQAAAWAMAWELLQGAALSPGQEVPGKGTEDCCSALRGEALSAFIYTHACCKTQKLLNQSFPLSVSLAGWRLPVQFRAEADKLLQDNGDDSSSCLAWVNKHPVVPPARVGRGVARAVLCQNGARTHPARSSSDLEPGGDNAPRCHCRGCHRSTAPRLVWELFHTGMGWE